MPRTKLQDAFTPKAPPIDWLLAAVLERQTVMGYTTKSLSEISGVSYNYMRKLMRKTPWEWPSQVRKKVCFALGIKLTQTVEGAPTS